MSSKSDSMRSQGVQKWTKTRFATIKNCQNPIRNDQKLPKRDSQRSKIAKTRFATIKNGQKCEKSEFDLTLICYGIDQNVFKK